MSEITGTQPAAEAQQDETGNPADAEAALRFLDFIFAGVTGGFAEFRYFGAGRRPKKADEPTYLSLPIDRNQLASQVLSRNGTQVITVGLAPRCRVPTRGKPGKDGDITQVNCVWVHLDYNRASRGALEIVQRIRNFPLRPSIIVNSGFGCQMYFVFNSPLSEGRLPEWDDITCGIRDVLQGDMTSDLCRVMILPGTINLEEPQSPRLCSVSDEDSSWTRYSSGELKEAITKACETPPNVGGSSRRRPYSMETLMRRGVAQDVLKAIVTGQRITLTGDATWDLADHAGRDLWIATSLLEKDFREDEIKTVFRSHPSGCGGRAREGGGEKYLNLILKKATAAYEERRMYSAAREAELGGGSPPELPPCYSLRGDGSLWYEPPFIDVNGKAPKTIKVANSFLRVAMINEHIDTGLISVVVEYDYLGQTRRKTISRSQMSDARQLVAALAGDGAPVTSNNARHVTSYLEAYEHTLGRTLPRKKITTRFGRGRAGPLFFFPGAVSGVEFEPIGPGDASLLRAYTSRQGSLRGWLNAMGKLADEQLLIPQAATLAALVPPLQSRLQLPNFILDVSGSTSSGKSTSLKLAASVYGRPNEPDSLVMQWMNTRAAVEQVAGTCSGLPIFLDDAQHCPDDLKRSVIYMIANGRGKGRAAGRGGGICETPTWHTVALSTSEEPLCEASRHEGARGRILPVGGGVPPFPAGSGGFVQLLEGAVSLHHGHAGEAYIRHLNGLTESEWSGLQRRYAAIRAEFLRGSSSNLVGRVSGYIAAIQLAGEVACPLLGLPFRPELISAWLLLHLSEQQHAQNQILLALRALADHYVKNINHFAGDGNYLPERRLAVHGSSKREVHVAFLRSTLDAVFRPYKWGQTGILNKLAEAGVLSATEEDRHTKKVCVGGLKHRMVCVKWSALFLEGGSG